MPDFTDLGYLRREAQTYGVELTGKEEPDELVKKIFEGILTEDLFLAYAVKFQAELVDWNATQWREIADYLGPENSMRKPAFIRGYQVIVDDIVSDKFPELRGNYDQSFVMAMIGITEGNLSRVESGIEALSKFHAGKDMTKTPYNGDMLAFLYQSQIVDF